MSVTSFAKATEDAREAIKPESKVFGALVLTAPWVPAAMILATAGVVIGAQSTKGDTGLVVLGAALGVVAWLVGSALISPTLDAASRNPSQFNALHRRLIELENRLAYPKPTDPVAQAALKEAEQAVTAGKEILLSKSALPWVFASGYNEVWKRFHQAAEALTNAEDPDQVLSAALKVRNRLTESTIGTKATLLADLQKAIDDGVSNAKQLRRVVFQTSKAVDEYRDGRWDTIIELRNNVRFYTAFLGGLSYLGLVLIVANGGKSTAILAVTAYLIVGALVGLISRGQAQAEATAAVEDFGLDRARAGFTILLSAVVAVLSVGLIALLATDSITTLIQPPATSAPGDATTSATTGESSVDLATPYDLGRYRGGLLIAAIFGLSPRLLLSTLSAQAERLKTELQSTEASEVKK